MDPLHVHGVVGDPASGRSLPRNSPVWVASTRDRITSVSTLSTTSSSLLQCRSVPRRSLGGRDRRRHSVRRGPESRAPCLCLEVTVPAGNRRESSYRPRSPRNRRQHSRLRRTARRGHCPRSGRRACPCLREQGDLDAGVAHRPRTNRGPRREPQEDPFPRDENDRPRRLHRTNGHPSTPMGRA